MKRDFYERIEVESLSYTISLCNSKIVRCKIIFRTFRKRSSTKCFVFICCDIIELISKWGAVDVYYFLFIQGSHFS